MGRWSSRKPSHNRSFTFNCEADKGVLTLGVNYVGLIDDVAVFDRELTDEEVRAVHALPHGIATLR